MRYLGKQKNLYMVELGSIIVLGILAQWIAWKFKVPAILPLILIGLAVGPFSTFYTESGTKWLEPIWNEGRNSGLFPGSNLFYFVELSIGIILFEGGLTLKRNEIKGIGPSIFNLITIGALITFFGAAIFTYYMLNLPWTISFLFAGLIIVTGPTVIAPILRNVPLKKDVANVLKWEGILIDPIGALTAVLVFEFIISLGSSGGDHFTQHAFIQFIQIALVGCSLGFFAAKALSMFIVKNWVPHYLLNVFTLAVVIATFVGSGIIVHDSSLLTIVVMGLVLGNMENVPHIKEILYFKESLSVLLISVLFILLSANIDIKDLQLLLNWKCIAVFAFVVFVLRPLSVFISTRPSNLSLNEKLFISWVGPRGIVAAGIASLFGLRLVDLNYAGAEYITPLVFMIVLGTVLLNATTAKLMASLLGVSNIKTDGILFVGANKAARLLAKYLNDHGREVVLLDSNASNISKSHELGLKAFEADVYKDEMKDNLELSNMGYMLALTGSADVNKHVLNKYRKNFGENGAYRLVSVDEMNDPTNNPEEGLFSNTDDYINFSEVARDYPQLHEKSINTAEEFNSVLESIYKVESTIPVLLKDAEDTFHIITSRAEAIEINEGSTLIYMGKELKENLE